MGRMRTIDPLELEALPIQIHEVVPLRCTPEQLFASFERAGDWKQWLDVGITETTEGRYREGFTRRAKFGPFSIDEVFTIWDAPRQMGFYAERGTNPLLFALAERYTVTETASGCTLEWRVGADMGRASPILGLGMKALLLRSARRGYPTLARLAAAG